MTHGVVGSGPERAGDLVGDAAGGEPLRAALGGEVEAVAAGEKAGPVISDEDWPVTRRNGATTVVRGDHADLHVAAVLGDVQVADGGSR